MPAWSPSITSPGVLVTGTDLARRGFARLALEKTSLASPHVSDARHLRSLLEGVADATQVWDSLKSKRRALLTAAGLSEKSLTYLTPTDQREIFDNMLERHLLPAGDDFRDELAYRYLLTRGDSLGGEMRNLGGIIGKRIMAEKLDSALTTSGIKATFDTKRMSGNHTVAKSISWEGEKGARSLWLDKTVPQTGTNVDFVLVRGPVVGAQMPSGTDSYLAVGELKAGIDPSAADERWKTANSALERLRRSFGTAPPWVFFVGAAISPRIAEEIYGQLVSGKLHHAANFLVDDQLSVLCEWLIGL